VLIDAHTHILSLAEDAEFTAEYGREGSPVDTLRDRVLADGLHPRCSRPFSGLSARLVRL